MRRRKKEEAAEPEPVKVPARGTLLNSWARKQEKLRKLSDDITKTQEELAEIATILHQAYGVLVQDTTKPSRIQSQPPTATASEEDEGEGQPELKPENNPLAKTPTPIIGQPQTAPVSEAEIAQIREDAQPKGADPNDFAADINRQMGKVVGQGFRQK